MANSTDKRGAGFWDFCLGAFQEDPWVFTLMVGFMCWAGCSSVEACSRAARAWAPPAAAAPAEAPAGVLAP